VGVWWFVRRRRLQRQAAAREPRSVRQSRDTYRARPAGSRDSRGAGGPERGSRAAACRWRRRLRTNHHTPHTDQGGGGDRPVHPLEEPADVVEVLAEQVAERHHRGHGNGRAEHVGEEERPKRTPDAPERKKMARAQPRRVPADDHRPEPWRAKWTCSFSARSGEMTLRTSLCSYALGPSFFPQW